MLVVRHHRPLLRGRNNEDEKQRNNAGFHAGHYSRRLSVPRIGPPSEDILQCELHDSRSSTRRNLTELRAGDVQVRVAELKAVCNVESLRSKFHSLSFADLEFPGQGGVELCLAGAENGGRAHISERAIRG